MSNASKPGQCRERASAREIAEALLDAVEAYAEDKYREPAIRTVEQCIKDIASLSSGGGEK